MYAELEALVSIWLTHDSGNERTVASVGEFQVQVLQGFNVIGEYSLRVYSDVQIKRRDY